MLHTSRLSKTIAIDLQTQNQGFSTITTLHHTLQPETSRCQKVQNSQLECQWTQRPQTGRYQGLASSSTD
jgi:hypothetical protein